MTCVQKSVQKCSKEGDQLSAQKRATKLSLEKLTLRRAETVRDRMVIKNAIIDSCACGDTVACARAAEVARNGTAIPAGIYRADSVTGHASMASSRAHTRQRTISRASGRADSLALNCTFFTADFLLNTPLPIALPCACC
jgi:hypothetical protein